MGKFFKSLAALVLLSAAFVPSWSAADALCPYGYTVGFFNGVDNTFVQARASMETTRQMIRETQSSMNDVYDSEDVDYQLFYNTTGSMVNSNFLQDIAEVFIQRAKELDPSGGVGNNYMYLFWEWLDGPPQNYSSVPQNPLYTNFFAKFVNAAVSAGVAAMADLITSPPTASDYALQESQLTTAANAGRKLLLVAHSQGNLFVNHAYTFIQPVVSSPRVKVVHVAPASPTLSGDWELSQRDIVINGLREVTGAAGLPANNLDLAFTTIDNTGHGYLEIYTNSALIDSITGRDARSLLKDELLAALVAMDQQQCQLSITPPSSTVAPGGTVTLNALLTPPMSAESLASVTYKWTIGGAAGGTFINPVTGAAVTSTFTATPTVTYYAAANAPDGAVDSVNVDEEVSTANNNNETTKSLTPVTTTPALITVNSRYAATLSPLNPISVAGAATTFTVAVTGALPQGVIYQWAVAGSAGGTLTNPTNGSAGSGFQNTSTSAVYTASGSATSPQQDTVTVTVFAPNTATPPVLVALTNASSIVSFNNPWVGSWVGNTVSTCGYYSGPQNFTITQINATTLNFGPYQATFSGNQASVNGGAVVFTLSGNTMTGYEADSCQNGTYTRQ